MDDTALRARAKQSPAPRRRRGGRQRPILAERLCGRGRRAGGEHSGAGRGDSARACKESRAAGRAARTGGEAEALDDAQRPCRDAAAHILRPGKRLVRTDSGRRTPVRGHARPGVGVPAPQGDLLGGNDQGRPCDGGQVPRLLRVRADRPRPAGRHARRRGGHGLRLGRRAQGLRRA